MAIELEAKFTQIDTQKTREKLRESGAELKHPEVLMRRKVFDYSDFRLEKAGGWVRVRDEGNCITMTYKQLTDRTLQGTTEITVKVDDFEEACGFLTAIGLDQKAYQETKREKWELNGCEITIDTWPWIPTFAEIEGPTEEAVKEAGELLGFGWQKAMHGSVETAYQEIYDTTEEEIDHWDSITFIPVPEWLEKKRKQ